MYRVGINGTNRNPLHGQTSQDDTMYMQLHPIENRNHAGKARNSRWLHSSIFLCYKERNLSANHLLPSHDRTLYRQHFQTRERMCLSDIPCNFWTSRPNTSPRGTGCNRCSLNLATCHFGNRYTWKRQTRGLLFRVGTVCMNCSHCRLSMGCTCQEHTCSTSMRCWHPRKR